MGVVEDIVSAAQAHGVDPATALATAWRESKLNPRAVGDNGHSFGLFQLSDTGELGGHTPEWAFNPVNNANTALSVMGQVTRQHPDWSPGMIAVAAQRPSPSVRPGYMADVNRFVAQIKAGTLRLPDPPDNGVGSGPVTTPPSSGGAPDPSVPTAINTALSGASNTLSPEVQQILTEAENLIFPGLGSVVQVGQATVGVLQLVGVLLSKLAHFFTLPHLAMRLFAGWIGFGFLIIGTIMFIMGEG